MIKKILMEALLCFPPLAMSAQQQSDKPEQNPSDTLYTDTVPYLPDMQLNEVTVKARSIIFKGDRKIILPTQTLIHNATDGMDVLQKLHLPRVMIHPLSHAVTLSNNGKVRLCINGIQVSEAELAAVPPKDIIRIEFHDAPGARYGDADAVIDYITRHHVSGGELHGDFLNAVGNRKHVCMDEFSARYNRGKSEWSAQAGYFDMTRQNWVRDYEEQRVYPDRIIHRKENGAPVPAGQKNIESHLSYSLREKDRYLFNARLSYLHTYVPNSEEGDRRSLLLRSDTEEPIAIYEHTTEYSQSPSLNLFLQHKPDSTSEFIVDVTAAYIHTDSRHTYQEHKAETGVANILSDIHGNQYSLTMEGCYARNIGIHRLTGGIRHLQSHTINRYAGTYTTDVSIRQAETALYAEYICRQGKWSYRGNLTASRIAYHQPEAHTEAYTLQPSLSLSFEPDDRLFIRYQADLKTDKPQIAALSNVEQEIDTDWIRRGNPNLKAFQILNQRINTGYIGSRLSVDLTVGYRHEFHPIMESVSYDGQQFVSTYENQRSFQRLDAEATLVLHPWKKHITLSASPQLHRFISRGNAYLHTHTIFRFCWDAEFTWNNWLLGYHTFMGPDNTMYGEWLTEEKNMHLVMAGYRRERWAVQAGVFNPFLKEYWMKTENRSALTPSTARAHCNANMYATVKLTFHLSYGRQSENKNRLSTPSDMDTGIMRSTRK